MNSEAKVKEIMQDIFGETITEDYSKYNAEKWDSFAHLDLMVRLESEFHISFTPDEMGEMESLQDILRIMKEK